MNCFCKGQVSNLGELAFNVREGRVLESHGKNRVNEISLLGGRGDRHGKGASFQRRGALPEQAVTHV